MQARAWAAADDRFTRLRLRVRHPMDTGLAPGIPAFYLEDLAIRDADGRELARIDSFEPVSENPVFTVEVTPSPGSRSLGIDGRDNNGTEIEAEVPCRGGRARWTLSGDERRAQGCGRAAVPDPDARGQPPGRRAELWARAAPDRGRHLCVRGAAEHFTAANGGNILNSGFIVTDDGVIVIQTGPNRRYGEEMRPRSAG